MKQKKQEMEPADYEDPEAKYGGSERKWSSGRHFKLDLVGFKKVRVKKFLTPSTSIIHILVTFDDDESGDVIPVNIRNDGKSCVETVLEQIRTVMTEKRHVEMTGMCMNLYVRVPKGGSIEEPLQNAGYIFGDKPFHKMAWYNERCDTSLTIDLIERKLCLCCKVFACK